MTAPSTTARRATTLAVPAVALVLLLASCGSSATATGTSSAAAPAATAGTQPAGGGGVFGTIATVSDHLLQVQDSSSQTAVAWTDSTTISAQVAGALSDVSVGSCVVAVTAAEAGATASAGSTATSVRISPSTDGSCTDTVGSGLPSGPGGTMPSGGPSGMPSGGAGGQPSGMPSGMPSGGAGAGFGSITAGLVTAVSGSTVTLQVTGQDSSTTATVQVSDATTYTTTTAADSSALVAGQCVSARGAADDSGKVTATSLTVSAPTDGACTTRTQGGPGGQPGQQQGGSTNG